MRWRRRAHATIYELRIRIYERGDLPITLIAAVYLAIIFKRVARTECRRAVQLSRCKHLEILTPPPDTINLRFTFLSSQIIIRQALERPRSSRLSLYDVSGTIYDTRYSLVNPSIVSNTLFSLSQTTSVFFFFFLNDTIVFLLHKLYRRKAAMHHNLYELFHLQ